MNTLSYIFTFLILSITFTNCSDDADDGPVVPDPVEGLHKIYEFSEANHSIEIYSEKTNLEVGYNEIFIRIKKSAGDYLSDAAPSWMPMMQMQNMSHSAPHSALGNVAESTVY